MPMNMSPDNWAIETILPTREVHLIGGPSGVGKSTWIFQMLADWKEGKPIFGLKSNPGNFIYVSCDRSDQSVGMTMDRVESKFPCFSVVNRKMVGKSYRDILNAALAGNKDVKLIIMDGMTSLCPGGKINDYQVVSIFLNSLTMFCIENNVAILGSVHTTKTKEGERILNPRQKVVGSTAWAAYSDTIFIMEPADSTDESSKRVLEIMPRNSKHIRKMLQFTDAGRLEEVDTDAPVQAGGDFLLEMFVDNLPFNEDIPAKLFVDAAKANNVPIRTQERGLAKLVEAGKLTHPGKGIYRRANAN
jgi:RecA-family ATPase